MAWVLDEIRTEHLLLRGINETDVKYIVRWRSNPDVYKYFKSAHQITVEEHLDWFSNVYLKDKNRYDWICFEKESGHRIGVFGLYRDGEAAEVNYLLASEAQRKGYATEAIQKLIRYASEVWNCKRVIAEIHEENARSISLVERIGFKLKSKKSLFLIYEIEV